MPLSPRTSLVRVDPAILSCYGRHGSRARADLIPLASLASGWMTPDAAAALLALHHAVLAAGGDFRVTDAFRDYATQASARARYDRWVAAGSPNPGTSTFNKVTMKADFVARPGRSNHNAGRAVDLDIGSLAFPGLAADRQLDRLWEVARPLGWKPIIKAPTEGATESWHFDFLGEWAPVQARVGYEGAAIAAAQDAGQGEEGSAVWRRAQGGLQRAGYDVGDIDGSVGKRTEAGLAAAGWRGPLSDSQGVVAFVDSLPSSPTVLWHP